MKQLFAAFILSLLTSLSAVAQPEPDTLWTRSYDGIGIEGAVHVLTTPDGGSLVSGHYNLAAASCFLWLIRTDSNGDTLWTQTYAGLRYIPNSIKETKMGADGSFTTVCYTTNVSPSGGPGHGYLVRTSADGDSVWTQHLTTISGATRSLEILPDRTILISGTHAPGGPSSQALIKTDSLGNTLWTRYYAQPGGVNNSLLMNPDGGAVLAGFTTDSLPVINQQGTLIRVDANGDTIWTREFGGTTTPEQFYGVQATPTGFVATGRSAGFLYAVYVDNNGGLLMDSVYTPIFYNVMNYMLRPSGDHNIVVGYGSDGVHTMPYLTCLDDDGAVLWHDTINVSTTTNCFGFSASPTPDGGLYVAANFVHAFLIRTGPGAYNSVPLLTAPNGGECLLVGDTFPIQWSFPVASGNAQVQIDRNYPSAIWETLATTPVSSGAYLWSVTGPLTYHARIRVVLESNSTVGDSSDADFGIIYPGPAPLWTQQHFPGGVSEVYTDAFERAPSGFIAAGTSPLPARFIFSDVILVKTDLNGDSLWKKTFGGERNELSSSVIEDNGGDYVFAAASESFSVGGYDIWIVKTDSNGDTIWTKTYGGTLDDIPAWIEQTDDRGYIITGRTNSFGAGGNDLFLLKLDNDGNDEWFVTHGGSNDDMGYEVHQTSDGGYIVAGGTFSYGAGSSDFYVLKTDDSGADIWRYVGGGSGFDEARSVKQLSTGAFIVGATLTSASNTDLHIFELREGDGALRWANTIDKGHYEYNAAVLLDDDGYLLVGSTGSTIEGNDQFLLVKTDFDGLPRAIADYGTGSTNVCHAARSTADNGVIMAGANGDEGYLVRIGDAGPLPCPAPDSVTVRATSSFPERNVLNWHVDQSGTYTVYSTSNMNLNTVPPAAGWTLEGSVYGIAGLTTSFTDVLVGDPAVQKKYVVRLNCP